MALYSYALGFLTGLCSNECIDKTDSYFFKPVVCTVICGTAGVIGLKVAYDNVGPAYDRISSVVKPFIKGYLSYKVGAAAGGGAAGAAGGAIHHIFPHKGNLPPVPNIAADIARNRGRGF